MNGTKSITLVLFLMVLPSVLACSTTTVARGQSTCIQQLLAVTIGGGSAVADIPDYQGATQLHDVNDVGVGLPVVLSLQCGQEFRIRAYKADDDPDGWKIGWLEFNGDKIRPDIDGTAYQTFTLIVPDTVSDSWIRVQFVPLTEPSDSTTVWHRSAVYADSGAHIEFEPYHGGYTDATEVTATCVPHSGYVISAWGYSYRSLRSVGATTTDNPVTVTNSSINTVYNQICLSDRIDPPGDNGECLDSYGVVGRGTMFVDGVEVGPFSSYTKENECGTLSHVTLTPGTGWAQKDLRPTPETFEGWWYGSSFYSRNGYVAQFNPDSNNGVFWIESVVKSENGTSIERAPDKTAYYAAEDVTLSCIPESGYEFVQWESIFDTMEGHVITAHPQLTFTVEGDSRHVCVTTGGPKNLYTEALVRLNDETPYVDNSLLSRNPPGPNPYPYNTVVNVTSAVPDIGDNASCEHMWYWYVPDVSPDWHELPGYGLTVPVNLDHDKWFRIEWTCATETPPEDTPTPTPTMTSSPVVPDTPTAIPTQTQLAPDTPTPTATEIVSPVPSQTPTPVSSEDATDVFLPIGRR